MEMENQVQIFDNPEFGEVRVIMKDGEPHFVAADVCRALEISNVSDALSRLDDDEKSLAFIPAMGIGLTDTHGGQEMLVVNEPGLYRLIFASRKPEAKKFQRWVYHEVLPSIRKTGSYSIAPDKTTSESAFEREKLAFECEQLAAERERLAFECEQLAAEREILTVEREILTVEREILTVERKILAIGRKKFHFENSKYAKIFALAQLLRDLASESSDEK